MAEQQIDSQLLEQTRREIGKLVTEIEQLANSEISEAEFYAEFLRRVCTALAAHAGALWIKTAHGNLQLQFQINLQAAGIHGEETARQAHDELLRYALAHGKPSLVAPHSGPGDAVDEGVAPSNPTDFLLVFAPVMMEGQTVGLVEVFQDPRRRSAAQQGYLHFLTRIAGELTTYLKNRQLRQVLGQQQLWDQIESYIHTVHGGLNPTQVAYLVANDGKKLVGCERVSLAVKRGRKTRIEAISGQDIVEKKSNLVRKMAELAGVVLKHGENLIYNGDVEEHWPKDVVAALEAYLHESGSKLIILMPMSDTREFGVKDKADAALIVEMVEDSDVPDDMAGRVEVVCRHGGVALYNALEYHRIPMLPVMRAVGNLTHGLRSHMMPKVIAVVVLIAALTAGMVFVPWSMRLEGRGELVPDTLRKIYAPQNGLIKEIRVDHGDETEIGSTLVVLGSPELEREKLSLEGQRSTAGQALSSLEVEREAKGAFDPELGGRIAAKTQELQQISQELELVKRQMEMLEIHSPIRGQVMDWQLREKLSQKPVEQGQVLMEVADVEGPWILSVQLPESIVSHVVRAMKETEDGRLPVDYVLSAAPDRTYKGWLVEVATQANATDTENIVEAKIELDPEGEMPALKKGAEVRAKIDCGPKAVGYVLFRELIDFVREYVFF